ncbi:Glycosyltransferase, GT2 family [Bizionia echini]|uniref:Glycosyltransferase, GT2 family n=1 Tax=Bizionia echini TaxID=649333 RepID=A0A1I5BC26_9FLAO|nr:glycosyltransferase [Bizionia echini]SFN72246.1 Glycosyltransferase, GT2 family [Bizionia echini]
MQALSTDITAGVSIIVCTYNGKTRLAETLKHLVAQQLDVPCEVILVDNASTDGTKKFADGWWAENGRDSLIEYRSFIQPKPGKSYAQELGYKQALFNYLLICDDDNWLCDTYVQTAFDIMTANPNIGALGGWCDAVFEGTEPDWFKHYARVYAVGKQSRFSGDVTEAVGYLYGAGMVLRKTHWLALKQLGFEHLLSCRKGDSLSSGGDTEYCFALRLLGYSIWYDERLYFKHFMTAGRLNLSYLSRLRQAMAYSNFVILAYMDVVENIANRKHLYTKRLFKHLKQGFFKNIYRRLFGSYSQQEVSKTYFRKLYYLSFRYDEYLGFVLFIRSWMPKKRISSIKSHL